MVSYIKHVLQSTDVCICLMFYSRYYFTHGDQLLLGKNEKII